MGDGMKKTRRVLERFEASCGFCATKFTSKSGIAGFSCPFDLFLPVPPTI